MLKTLTSVLEQRIIDVGVDIQIGVKVGIDSGIDSDIDSHQSLLSESPLLTMIYEDPVQAIQELSQNLHLESDKASFIRIQESLDTLSSARTVRLDELSQTLSDLGRKLSQTRSQYHVVATGSGSSTGSNSGVIGDGDGLVSDRSRASDRHANEINRLDTDKFRIAKQANELEIEAERLDIELNSLRARLADLDEADEDGGLSTVNGLSHVDRERVESVRRRRGADDSDDVVLRLKVYRSLGIDVETADPVTGQYTRAVIRNPARGDVHVVNIDSKFSRFFYANYFWQTLG